MKLNERALTYLVRVSLAKNITRLLSITKTVDMAEALDINPLKARNDLDDQILIAAKEVSEKEKQQAEAKAANAKAAEAPKASAGTEPKEKKKKTKRKDRDDKEKSPKKKKKRKE